jgi:hypothetical protein
VAHMGHEPLYFLAPLPGYRGRAGGGVDFKKP